MTQTANSITPAEADALSPMSVERYHELIDAGVLTADDKVELVENRLAFKMSKNPPHAFVKAVLNTLFDRLLPTGWCYRAEDPITLSDSEPEPDGAVVRGTHRDYLVRHPYAADVALLIEVAESSLAFDRRDKQRVYARAGIGVYWIVNLVDRVIEVHTDPQPTLAEPTYANRQDYAEADAVPVLLDGQTVGHVAVRDVLP